MIDPLVKRDLALIAAGKTPVGNPDEAMALAILSIVDYLETPHAAPEPPPPFEPTGESAEKEDT